MMGGFGGHSWGMGFGWIIGILLLVAIIWIIVKYMNQNSNTHNSVSKSAIEILKERYTRGEIGKEEFEKKKKDI